MNLFTLSNAKGFIKNCKGFQSVEKCKGVLYPCFSTSDFQILTSKNGEKMFVLIFADNSLFEAQF